MPNPNLLTPITKSDVETFRRDGVVWLKGVLDAGWINLLGEGIADLMANPIDSAVSLTNLGLLADMPEQVDGFIAGKFWGASDKGWAGAEAIKGVVLRDEKVKPASGKRGHFWSITGAWRHHANIRALAFDSPVPEIAATLMESDNAFLCGEADQILVKPPLTAEKTAWHQDLPYDNIAGAQRLAVRIPCDREMEDMGTIGYVRGSHRTGTEYKVNFFISDVTDPQDPGAALPQIEGHEDAFDIVRFTPEPGVVVVHHIGVVHGAGANRSATRTRRAITIRYCGGDVVYKPRATAPPVYTARDIKAGDKVTADPELFPRAWPPRAHSGKVDPFIPSIDPPD